MLTATGLLAGCSDGPELDLAGREFTTTEARGHEMVAGTTVRLTFDEDIVSAHAGCNTLFGGAAWADGTLTIDGEIAMTMMACDAELQAQDQWLADFLASEPSIALDGDTLILGDAEGITLTEVVG